MIGKIKGTVSELFGNEALVETASGLYYQVYVTPDASVSEGASIELYTYLDVREDSLTLFGFPTHERYRIFGMIVGVDGVGPKTAFAIVSAGSSEALREAVVKSDVQFFQKIKGIGKKTAQRILVDLSGKFGEEFDLASVAESPEDADAVEALISLGFRASDVRKVLMKIDRTLTLEERLKAALQQLSHVK